jgi:hypothetical protein
MASKATERITRIMTKLAMEGKLDKPYYPGGQRNTIQSKVADNRERRANPVQSDDCCVGSLSRLPDGVVSCPGCPLDSDGST